MNFTNDFFIQAQGCIERVLRTNRPALLEAKGRIKTEAKEDKTPVTEFDRAYETDLKKALCEFDASIGFEGEEFGAHGSRETFWLVDPIDGTEALTRGLPTYRNMVTLIDNKEPVFAVVYKPATDELYVAAKGEGAYRNGRPISVSSRPLDKSRLEIHSPGSNPDTWDLMKQLSVKVNAIRIMGDFLPVAEGAIDGLMVYNGGGGPWDFAPRALLIREAGGRVANIGSDKHDYTQNDMLAANPIIFDDLMKIITEAIDKK